MIAGPRPRVALVLAGGTIATGGATRLDLSAYHETGLRFTANDLLDDLPEVSDLADLVTVDFRSVSSTAITVDDWLDLVEVVESLAEECVGVVVAHGTNTLEETAYFLDLCVRSERPVVFVGAMRPRSALSSDGPLNLLRAVQVALSPHTVGQGVLVAMGERIFTARDVNKTSSQSVDAFQAPDSGPVGFIDPEGRVVIERTRVRRGPRFTVRSGVRLPRVDIVMSYVGADGVLIDAAVAAGARGIVSAGTGAGRTTPSEEAALMRAIESEVLVCRSSRVASGVVVPTPATASAGFVAARGLVPWKARSLLALALSSTHDPVKIQSLFDEA